MAEGKEKKEKSESEWDKKKIIFITVLAFILLILFFSFFKSNIGLKSAKIIPQESAVRVNSNTSVKKSVQSQIENIKQEAGSLDLVEVATSSPQVQKIINDLKALKDYPNNQLKQTCVDICQKL